ncbi:unnamed protein product, partial [Brassica rapa subsp. trilocularis]
FLRKLVKVKDGLASDVVEKSESKGRRLEMGDEIYCWRERKVCGAGREREREQRSKHLDKVKALKVATFVSFTMDGALIIVICITRSGFSTNET